VNSPATPPLIAADGLHFAYPDGMQALHDLTFHAQEGEIVALMGTNGSGKTTLLKVLMRLLRPQQGTVRLAGEEIGPLRAVELYRRVGMVFQNPADQLFATSVAQDVAFGPRNLGLPEAEVSLRVEEALAAVDVTDLGGRPIHHLSFGQQKRVCLAGVLAMRPQILLLDEPTAGLDPVGEGQMIDLLMALNQRQKITLVLATHCVDLLPVAADRIYVLSQGRVWQEGTPREVFADPARAAQAGLRIPLVAQLFHELCGANGLPAEGLPLTVAEARQCIVGGTGSASVLHSGGTGSASVSNGPTLQATPWSDPESALAKPVAPNPKPLAPAAVPTGSYVQRGTLYGIGVGPGDPQWMTVQATRVLGACRHVCVPMSGQGPDSLALEIARPYLGPEAVIHEQAFPMTSDENVLRQSWQQAAREVLAILDRGEDCAFLTLGDALLYSTYIYLLRELRTLCPAVNVVTVPGITAFSAAAALTNFAVGQGKQPVTIVPASDDLDPFTQALDRGGTVVLMKIGRRLEKVLDALDARGLLGRGVFVAYAGMPQQQVETDLRRLRGQGEKTGYLSLVIVQAGS
jgi:cobalt/nickel transport system ATP-binding protein